MPPEDSASVAPSNNSVATNHGSSDSDCHDEEEAPRRQCEQASIASKTTTASTTSVDLPPPPVQQQSSSSSSSSNKDIVIPNCCPGGCCGGGCGGGPVLLRANHNVVLNLLLCMLYGISDSLWSGTVFVAYLKRWSDNQNSLVGNIEALNGLAMLVSALPVGYLADTYGRSRVIRAGGLLIAATALAHILLVDWIGTSTEHYESHTRSTWSLLGLATIMALWGIGGGIVTGPCDALFADSTPAGERSKYYQYQFICYMVASCCGPLAAIVLFQTMGDDWDLYHLRAVLYVGLSLEFINALIMLNFDDNKALDENTHVSSPLSPPPATTTTTTATTFDDSLEGQLRQPLLVNGDNITDPLPESSSSTTTTTTTPVPTTVEQTALRQRQRCIPYILFTSSLVMAMGSGMTIKFFPLFFKDQVGLSPTQVQGIYVLAPLTMALFSWMATSVSSWLGRVQTILITTAAGIVSLVGMVLGFDSYFATHAFPLVALYLIRTALMNCTSPLFGSILMDYVPKQERARWKSLESVASFSWCGSAALGGYISDRYSYNHTFVATAVLQSLGLAVLVLLLPLVPRKEADLLQQSQQQQQQQQHDETNAPAAAETFLNE